MKFDLPRPLILGHRGSPHAATENTLRSFAVAREQGADGVELDVRLSRDGTVVVIHDDTLERTLGVAGKVAALPWPALKKLTGARLPSLQESLAWAAASGSWVNIEAKVGGAEEAILRTVDDAGLRERVILSSFDSGVVRRFGEVDAAFHRFLLAKRWNPNVLESVRSCGAEGVCLRTDAADSTALASLRAEGLPVVVWTVNSPATVERLLRGGVAAIITDDPAMAAAVRSDLQPGGVA